ncbi:MAG TPA: hypothetical protein VJT71_15045 [Pyrinomonadaceae bacterium]|nr:hypothetical protein [Pyrinomonadaceae bacterium]
MYFSLDVIRARKGDCLMLHYGSKADPRLIMIDGGPRGVYQPHLRPRIELIREAREVPDDESLRVDMLMVSHVDDDHIQGILELTSELREADMEERTKLIRALSIWHNSFENLIGHKPDELTAAFTSEFGTASTEGDPPDDLTIDPDDPEVDEKTIVANIKVLASISQGAQLKKDAEYLNAKNAGYDINSHFEGKLIIANEDGKAINIGNGLKFTVAGPMKPELDKLYKKHQAWLKELKEAGKSPSDVLSAYVDKSVPNLSSLVILAEAGEDPVKRMLLTGDARGDKILEGLELVGLLKEGETMKVDVLKAPHHGSSNNLESDFFERIIADHYVFSGNGEHGNPERESLEMLWVARGNEDYKVHFTYPIDEIDAEREKDWNKERNKEKKKQEKNPDKEVRPEWSPEEHGVKAFFDENPDFAAKAEFVEEDEPHLINLLDELELKTN